MPVVSNGGERSCAVDAAPKAIEMNTPYVRKGMGDGGTERLVLRRLHGVAAMPSRKRVPRTVDEEDSWEASPQHPVTDRRRPRRSVSQAVTQARWASPASDLTDSPSAAWSGTHMNE